MDGTEQGQRELPGRVVRITAYGDTAAEIEMDALDKARAFFGDGPQLAIVPAYQAWAAQDWPEAGGKLYRAAIAVRVVEPA